MRVFHPQCAVYIRRDPPSLNNGLELCLKAHTMAVFAVVINNRIICRKVVWINVPGATAHHPDLIRASRRAGKRMYAL